MAEAFTIEEDAFQEHHHEHSHTYTDSTFETQNTGEWEPHQAIFKNYKDITRTTLGINHGKIVAADKTSDARIATETRPKNMKVVYLMKCWHLGQE